MSDALLSVRDLTVHFVLEEGELTALDRVSFDIPKGSVVALVGESGCGKTVTAHSIMRLLPTPPAHVDGGRVLFEGQDLLKLGARQMRALRGSRLSIVFQDPMSSLNPVYSIGAQLVEAYRIHQPISRSEAKHRAIELLRRVGFPDPQERFGDYPHELSGGMRQRVLIAIALACRPALFIADEPTTALDQIAAAELTGLLQQLQRDFELSMLLISHDIAMVSTIADCIVVLYAGQVVESGTTRDVLGTPQHPYTQALLRSIPPRRRRQRRRRKTRSRLQSIEGAVPDLRNLPAGCRFSPRCPEAEDRCRQQVPELTEIAGVASQPVWARCLLRQPVALTARRHGPASDSGEETP